MCVGASVCCIGARVCVDVCVCLCWCAYVEMFPFVFSPIKIAEGIGPTGDRVCVALYGNPIPYPDLTLTFAHIITLSLTLILNT